MMSAQLGFWLSLLAHGAPLLGLALWMTPFSFTGGGGWDFVKMFTAGLYMAAMGLLVPLAIWMTVGPGTAKLHALSALKFHGVVALIALAFGAAALVAALFDPANPTMSNPPSNFLSVLTAVFMLSTFVLPLVELGRVIYGIRYLIATGH